jgi:hypothetical protein
MRMAILSMLVSWGLSVGAMAQEARNPEIEGVIRSQIEAFLVDDFATAFTYASPNIKGMFGSPERFGMMVRQGYPMVWRPGEVRYLELRNDRAGLVQRVLIVDRAGVPHMLDYMMIETAEGWQINGVQLLRAPQAGA